MSIWRMWFICPCHVKSTHRKVKGRVSVTLQEDEFLVTWLQKASRSAGS